MGINEKVMNLAVKLLKTGIRVLGKDRAINISAQITEELAPIIEQETEFGTLRLFCPGKIALHRARTMFRKEPQTIEWIDTFEQTDIFWDIGANVGTYSLYAALRKMTVLSFEPSPGNYYLLSRNIEINKMDDRVSALCMAFNDETVLDSFYMANTGLGCALNSFAEPVDWRGEQFKATLKQAMLGFSIDDFVQKFTPPFPNHIKVDVDGIESKIITGAMNTLADERVKSIVVELDSDREAYCSEVINKIERAGLKFTGKKHAPLTDPNSFPTCHNYFFVRPRAQTTTII